VYTNLIGWFLPALWQYQFITNCLKFYAYTLNSACLIDPPRDQTFLDLLSRDFFNGHLHNIKFQDQSFWLY